MKKNINRIDYSVEGRQIKIDKKDKKILTILSQNARTPLTQISKKVGLSRDSVHYRIERLKKLSVIAKFSANINYDKLGFHLFHVFLSIDESKKGELSSLIKQLSYHDNIVSIIEYTDKWDLIILLVARDIVDFDTIASSLYEQYGHLIIDKQEVAIIRRYNLSFMPPQAQDMHLDEDRYITKQLPIVSIDTKDKILLKELSLDCRQSTYTLGAKAGLSADAVGKRIKRLYAKRVIRSFTIVVNLSLLGYQWYSFIIDMKKFSPSQEKTLEQFLIKERKIIRSVKTIGAWDLYFYVLTEKRKEFHDLVLRFRSQFQDAIRNYETWIAYKEHLYNTLAPVVIAKSG